MNKPKLKQKYRGGLNIKTKVNEIKKDRENKIEKIKRETLTENY